jgi:hypothetical protein
MLPHLVTREWWLADECHPNVRTQWSGPIRRGRVGRLFELAGRISGSRGQALAPFCPTPLTATSPRDTGRSGVSDHVTLPAHLARSTFTSSVCSPGQFACQARGLWMIGLVLVRRRPGAPHGLHSMRNRSVAQAPGANALHLASASLAVRALRASRIPRRCVP